MRKEILAECKRQRPNEFKHVVEGDIERVLNILYRNISYILKTNGLLAIKDYLIFRPNVNKMAKLRQQEEKKRLKMRAMRHAYLTNIALHHRLLQEDPYISTKEQKKPIVDH